MKKIALFGSCQVCHNLPYFMSNMAFHIRSFPFYEYDIKWCKIKKKRLKKIDYNAFKECDIAVVELNDYEGIISSNHILEYLEKNNPTCTIIKTPLIYFPIFPFNVTGYGIVNKERFNDESEVDKYLQEFDYVAVYNKHLEKFKVYNDQSDINIYPFIKENFRKTKLFNDCLHPTTALSFEFSKLILEKIGINIVADDYDFDKHIVHPNKYGGVHAYPSKMIKDLCFEYDIATDDEHYRNKCITHLINRK